MAYLKNFAAAWRPASPAPGEAGALVAATGVSTTGGHGGVKTVPEFSAPVQ